MNGVASLLEAATAVTRPLVTLILVGVLSVGFLKSMLSPDAFLGIAGMAIGWWYRDREATKEAAAVATQAAERAVEKAEGLAEGRAEAGIRRPG